MLSFGLSEQVKNSLGHTNVILFYLILFLIKMQKLFISWQFPVRHFEAKQLFCLLQINFVYFDAFLFAINKLQVLLILFQSISNSLLFSNIGIQILAFGNPVASTGLIFSLASFLVNILQVMYHACSLFKWCPKGKRLFQDVKGGFKLASKR